MKRLKGTQDILPAEVGIWNFIEDISRQAFNTYRYKEIRTPIIEEESLFVRSVGSDTDIVKKQMYAFKDQGKRDIVLRPEETASVVRAYLENRLDKTEGFVKLFYIGPMFRSERPQAGRLRQFHQIGVEAIGSDSAYLDAEVIILLDSLLKGYGLSDYTLKINSLGCEKDKANAKELLKKELKADLSGLCDDCKRRYKTNILRILDCKVDACKKIVSSVSLKGLLCKECDADFKLLQNKLDEAGIKYEASSLLVRGLDYYTGIVFEVSSKKLGSQDALAAGGRYDNLVSDLGGERTGACGFAIGIERVIGALPASYLQEKAGEDRKGVFLATIGEEAYKKGFSLLCELRRAGIVAAIDYQEKSLKAQMRYADKINMRHVIVLGDDELKAGSCLIRDMKDGSERQVKLNEIASALRASQ